MKTRNRLNLERLEVRDCPAADLVVENVTFKFAGDIVVPGDPGFVSFTVRNVGDEKANPANDKTGLHLYLSDTGNPFDRDFFLGRIPNKTLRLAPGGTAKFTALVEMPELSLPFPELAEGNYFVLAEADSGFRIPEDNDFNNTTASTDQLNYKFWVGDVGTRKNVSFDANSGGPLQFDLNGGGVGKVLVSGGIVDLSYEGTTEKSDGLIRGNGSLNLRNVTTNSVMRAVSLAANVTGTMNFNSGLGGLAVRELGTPSGNASLNIGTGFPKPAVLAFTRVENSNITVDGAIRLFLARQWIDTNGTKDTLSAASLKQMEINPLKTGLTPNFEANVNISGTPYDAKGHVVGTVRVGGFIKNSVWTIQGGVDAIVKEINPTAAENFTLDASTHVKRIEIPTNYTNSNTGQNSLKAASFGTIQVKGNLSVGPIVALAADEKEHAIEIFDLGNVNLLPAINAPAGGIKDIGAQHWPARTNIGAKWINKISLSKAAGLLTTPLFAPNLNLTGANPKSNLGLGAVDLRGGKIAGPSDGDRATWSLLGDVGTIDAYETENWAFNGNFGGGLGSRINKLNIDNDMKNSHLKFLSAKEITAFGFLGSSFVTPGDITKFIQKRAPVLTHVFTSYVEASRILKIAIRDVDGSHPSAFGIKAKSILNYERIDGNDVANPPNTQELANEGTYDVVGNYSVQIVLTL